MVKCTLQKLQTPVQLNIPVIIFCLNSIAAHERAREKCGVNVFAIVTDNAENMVKMRKILRTSYNEVNAA